MLIVRDIALFLTHKISIMMTVEMGKKNYEIPQDRVIRLPFYLPVSCHFPNVLTRTVEVAINTQRHRKEFTDRYGAEKYHSYVIYHENHNKYYYTDTRELKSPHFLPFALIHNSYYVRRDTYTF